MEITKFVGQSDYSLYNVYKMELSLYSHVIPMELAGWLAGAISLFFLLNFLTQTDA